MSTNIKERIAELLEEIGKGVYEKEEELRLGMLAALAGESIILLGSPGTAKSMVARRLKNAFKGARSFEYLMSRFSTPDDIFGPVSISKLKESDTYERVTDGYMPSSDVVFLDEIWKAGPAIQNTLLTVLNERVFRNGDKEIKLPLKLLIAASNELPAEGEGLEALWDRFLVRCISTNIKDEKAFLSMILDTHDVVFSDALKKLQITPKEYTQWQKQISEVTINEDVLQAILNIRNRLKHIKDRKGESEFSIYVSDRRWKKTINLLKTSAFIHGRKETNLADIVVLSYCLWNEPMEREFVREVVLQSIFKTIEERYKDIEKRYEHCLRTKSASVALQENITFARREDSNIILYDDFYYRLSTYNTGNTYIFASDFHRLPDFSTRKPILGHLYTDQTAPTKERIRSFEMPTGYNEGKKVTLARDDKYVYVNGVGCELERHSNKDYLGTATQPQLELKWKDFKLEQDIADLASELTRIIDTVGTNLFATPEDQQYIQEIIKEYRTNVALTRADISKLLYE